MKKLIDFIFYRELIKETRVALLTRPEIALMWHNQKLAVKGVYFWTFSFLFAFLGAISYGVDLAVLAMCNHTVSHSKKLLYS